MCGICGYVSTKRISPAILTQMNDAMMHRGPDDGGVIQMQSEDKQIGFGHRRLSILDLSELGHQPMKSLSGNSVITYNGEIYNFKVVRRELEQKGHRFKTNCDTEVILEAYEEYGIDFVSKFNGMFAFALYDQIKNVLVIARDRFGKKPLYYYYDKEKKDFVFSSTLRSIMLYPSFPKIIDKVELYKFFYYGYIAEPGSIFVNVSKLEPGTLLEFKINTFEIRKRQYWNIYDAYVKNKQNSIKEFVDCKEELRTCLTNSVKNRMISDVPIGTFLSGGIDSSLVTAIAQRVSATPVNTYSIGFEDEKYDESRYAFQISRHLGTEHHNLIISEEDMFSLVDDMPLYYDEPFSDSSQLPSMIVSKFARQDITVALTGDGGDELFCGYTGYDNLLKMQKYKQVVREFGVLINNKLVYNIAPPRVKSVINGAKHDSCQWESYALKSMLSAFLIGDIDDVLYTEDKRILNEGIQTRRMLLDMATYLPGDILHKVDRASMKYSLESRCPILDFTVAELSYRIPHEYKYNNGEKKYILKELTYDYIPRELLNRPKKGFSIPLRKVLNLDKVKRELIEYSECDYITKQGLFNYKELCKIRKIVEADVDKANVSYVNNSVNILWNYLVFQKWYHTYMGASI